MNTNHDESLESALEHLRCRATPAAPADLEIRVLRRIREAAARVHAPLRNSWQELVRPSVIAAALILAVLSSALVTGVTARDMAVGSKPEADPLQLRALCDPYTLNCFYRRSDEPGSTNRKTH